VVAGRVAGVDPDGGGGTVLLSDRRPLPATVVIDASGHEPVIMRITDRRPVAAQIAYGIVARFDAPPAAPGACTLMDWSWVPPAERAPSFLYALDLGDGWWLVEETSLAARPPVDLDVLRRRLTDGWPPVAPRRWRPMPRSSSGSPWAARFPIGAG
jgi:lycopene beta-cyclase